MSSKKQQLQNGAKQTQANIPAVAPVGDQAGRIVLGANGFGAHKGGLRPASYLITAVVTVAPSDLFMYGRVDTVWGLHSGRYNVTSTQGKIGTALAVGVHHIIVEDVGLYDELFFIKSAGNIDVSVMPILFSNYGS